MVYDLVVGAVFCNKLSLPASGFDSFHLFSVCAGGCLECVGYQCCRRSSRRPLAMLMYQFLACCFYMSATEFNTNAVPFAAEHYTRKTNNKHG